METTRHFVATLYVVNEGATALHRHPTLGLRLPPGGHIDRDELPHEAALREAREETGLDPTLVTTDPTYESETARTIPSPQHLLLEDINRHPDGSVGHQHVDHVFFARVDRREIDPDGDDEVPADGWDWYDSDALRRADLDEDVAKLGIDAIETVRGTIG
ncbi:MAG: NUDIX domain-containing protein [Haloferacaceae archaeon]